jgi:hypothetical protein
VRSLGTFLLDFIVKRALKVGRDTVTTGTSGYTERNAFDFAAVTLSRGFVSTGYIKKRFDSRSLHGTLSP